MKYVFFVLLGICFLAQPALAKMEMGRVPPVIEFKGKLGARVDGKPWSSEELKGKVHVIFYVDPDEKDLNNEASEALKKEKFPREQFQSLGIINMDATWLPNVLISSALKKKQEQYPTTIYIRDFDKIFVKKWGIADDNSNIVAFDKKGRLIFWKDGKLGTEDIKKLIMAIRDNLDN